MAGEVDVFVLDIRKFCEKAKGNISAAVRKIAFDLFTRIVFHTPVDTGRLRGNWQVAWDNPTMEQLDRTDKGGGSTLDAGLTVLNQIGSVAGHSIWLSNHLPYAIPIEYGHSKVKSPSGMVRVSIREVSNAYKGHVTELDAGDFR